MGYISEYAERVVHSRVATPVIIKARRGMLRDVVESIMPYELSQFLEKRILPEESLIRRALEAPVQFYERFISERLEMLSAYLPREIIWDVVQLRSVEQVYYDKPMWAFELPTVKEDEIYEYRKLKFTTTLYTRK